MHPQIHLNYTSILASVIISFVFASVWYGPLFGKKWARLMKMSLDKKPSPKIMKRALGLTLLGTFLTVFVLSHEVAIWRPSVWNLGADEPFYKYGFFAGFFIWVGFYVPLLLNAISWEGRSWALFWLNAAFHFINIQIIGMILSFFR